MSAGQPQWVKGKTATFVARGQLAGAYWALAGGGMRWTRDATVGRAGRPGWMDVALAKAPPSNLAARIAQYRVIAGSTSEDLAECAGGFKMHHAASRRLIRLAGPALAGWALKAASEKKGRGPECAFTRFSAAVAQGAGVSTATKDPT